MSAGQSRWQRGLRVATIAVLATSGLLANACALTHRRAPAIQELGLDYQPPELGGLRPVDAAITLRRFSALSPYDGTSMYFQRGGYEMQSFNYFRWVASPADQASDLLYRDLLASHAFRDVFTYLSTEQARFQLEGTVMKFLMAGEEGSANAKLVISITLADSLAAPGGRGIVMQREFTSAHGVTGNSAEQFAAGMSDAMRAASADIIRAVHDAAADRLAGERDTSPGG